MRSGLGFAFLAALAALPVQAQMNDPTRPPAVLQPVPPGASGAGSGPDAGPVAPQLQSVLISPKRSVAVIDGQTVRLGQRYRGAVVTMIAPTRVVLRRGQSTQILKLYPSPAGTATMEN